jgi:hypothetical protein
MRRFLEIGNNKRRATEEDDEYADDEEDERADDAAANAGEAQPRQSVLTQRVALSNSITMTRELEHGLSSSNARNRSLPRLENQGSYEHHDWRNREIGSHIEILLRYKENNTSIK